MTPEPTLAPPAPMPQPAAFNPSEAIARLREQGYPAFEKDFKFDPTTPTDDPFLRGIVGATTSNFYLTEDREIFEQTGIPKTKDEKTYEYRKRAFAQLQDQIKKAPDVEEVRKGYETQLSEKDKAIAEISLRGSLNTLKLNVDDSALEMQQELLLNKALILPHRIEGQQIVFQKRTEDGTLIDVIDPTTGKPMAPAKFLEAQFKPFLKVEQPLPQGPNAKVKPADTSAAVPKTKQDLVAMLQEEGVGRGGPEYMAKLKAKAIEYAIKLED